MIQVDSDFRHLDTGYALERLGSLLDQSCLGSEMLGWLRPYGVPTLRSKQRFEQIVVIGIGGSYLGTRAFYEAFGADIPVYFLGYHMATRATQAVLKRMEEYCTALVIVSKSGTTTEPALATRLALSAMKKGEVFVVTDENQGALRELANDRGYLCEVIPRDVGGRFSVFTPVGMLPLMLAGWDVASLVASVNASMSKYLEMREDNPCVQYASSRYRAFQDGTPIEVLAYHDPQLAYFAEWWKQLFGESEGKQSKGLFPASVCYSTDLHSMGQYLQDGPRHMLETFLTYNEPRSSSQPQLLIPPLEKCKDGFDHLVGKSLDFANKAAFSASRKAHRQGGLKTIELSMTSDFTTSVMADAMCFFMVSCAVSALMLKVNPFDQPGVEDYKKVMFGLLRS